MNGLGYRVGVSSSGSCGGVSGVVRVSLSYRSAGSGAVGVTRCSTSSMTEVSSRSDRNTS